MGCRWAVLPHKDRGVRGFLYAISGIDRLFDSDDYRIAARVESGLTQREVSSRLGIAHSFINKCESGELAIDVAELWALSRIYGKPLSFFAPDEE